MAYAALLLNCLGLLLIVLGIVRRLVNRSDYGISHSLIVSGLLSILLGAVSGLLFLCLM